MKISRRWLARLPTLTLGEVLDRIAAKMNERAFVHFNELTLSYRAFNEVVVAWRRALAGHGFNAGERAIIMAENSPMWCAVFMAVTSMGGIAVPLDINNRGDHLAALIARSGAHIVFTSRTLLANITQAIGASATVNRIVLIDDDTDGGGISVGRRAFLSRAGDETRGGGIEDICAILFTAGTTGEPKGVCLTHRNILAAAALALDLSGARRHECVLNPLPLYHVFPLVDGFIAPLAGGMQIALCQGLSRGEINEAVSRRRIGIMLCVPAFYAIVAARLRKAVDALTGPGGIVVRFLFDHSWVTASPRRFRLIKRLMGGKALGAWAHVRLLISGGAPLLTWVRTPFNALGLPLTDGYGLTETAAAISINEPRRYRAGSVGRPDPAYIEVKIDQPNGEGVGEILVRGPSVMAGYEGHKRSESFDGEGYFRTGDIGYLDDDGYLYITARMKDVIVPASGKNIYPAEIEQHYQSSPLVKDICVFGLHKEGAAGEIVHAAVVVADDILAHGEEVAYEWLAAEINRLSMELPSYKRVKSFCIWRGDFPRVSTGKTRKFEVAETVAHKLRAHDHHIVSVDDELMMGQADAHVVRDILTDLSFAKIECYPDTLLYEELGIRAPQREDLVHRLERRYACSIPMSDMMRARTVKDVIVNLRRSLDRTRPHAARQSYARHIV